MKTYFLKTFYCKCLNTPCCFHERWWLRAACVCLLDYDVYGRGSADCQDGARFKVNSGASSRGLGPAPLSWVGRHDLRLSVNVDQILNGDFFPREITQSFHGRWSGHLSYILVFLAQPHPTLSSPPPYPCMIPGGRESRDCRVTWRKVDVTDWAQQAFHLELSAQAWITWLIGLKS